MKEERVFENSKTETKRIDRKMQYHIRQQEKEKTTKYKKIPSKLDGQQ